MISKFKFRHVLLGILVLIVWLTQLIPPMGELYSKHLYPVIAYCLSGFSNIFPFAIGEIFIILFILVLIVLPVYQKSRKASWKRILWQEVEFLLWIYVWFYLAWGLNYSQPNFYERSKVSYTPFAKEELLTFANEYIDSLNQAYLPITTIHKDIVQKETVRIYQSISKTLGIHAPFHSSPKAKTILFTPLVSMVGVTGSMGPFICEFTLNGDLLPIDYPSTYAHEFSHLLGISSEAEANFYSYEVCTQSSVKEIRFSGYFSMLGHVLSNAKRLLTEEEYEALFQRIRPEVIQVAKQSDAYWSAKYSDFLGNIQNWVYDIYLKGNQIESGRKNYSEVVGLLISYNNYQREKNK